MLVYYQFFYLHLDSFSLVVRLITSQVLILFKMRDIEVIHDPMWDITIAVFFLFFLCEACVPKSH